MKTPILRPDPYRPETITATDAAAAGFWPVTNPYQLPAERWMLQRTLSDFDRAGTPCCLVGGPEAPEVWSGGRFLHNSTTAAAKASPPPSAHGTDPEREPKS